MHNIVRNTARYEGIKYHKLITDGLPQAYSAESIILRGDRFPQRGEDYLLVGESRLGTTEGPGRIDLGLFVKTVVTNSKRPGQLVVMNGKESQVGQLAKVNRQFAQLVVREVKESQLGQPTEIRC